MYICTYDTLRHGEITFPPRITNSALRVDLEASQTLQFSAAQIAIFHLVFILLIAAIGFAAQLAFV
jgi:hypothetical protein